MRTLLYRRCESISNWLAILTLLALGVVWPPANAADIDDARAGTLFLKSSAVAPAEQALRQSTRIDAQVIGNVARVHVTQTFTNQGSDWMEGMYVFPLPAGSAVDDLLMHIGDRVIRGDIKAREEARATYERAKAEGRRASLVSQERPNMFTTAVANIPPASTITIEIGYLDVIEYRDQRYTLHLPLAITPRYTPGVPASEFDGVAVAGTPEQVTDTAGTQATGTAGTPEQVTAAQQQVAIDIELDPGFALGSVESLHHSISTMTTSNGRRIALSSPEAPGDRDFELVWTPAAAQDTQATAFSQTVGSDTYVLVALTPPEVITANDPPRELIFIIDTSGSMEGPSIQQARAALQLGVDRLTPADRFNIIRFSNDATALFSGSRPVDTDSRASAAGFIAGLKADGGTEMRSALELAFATQPIPGILRQIVFITDGSVGNEADLVRMIQARIGSARLFTVGIGPAPNVYFMEEAAAAGRGSYTFIAQREQVGERMQDLFRKLEHPALMSLGLQWPGGAVADLARSLPNDLYVGDPLVIVARLKSASSGMVTLTGTLQGAAWVHQLPMTVVGENAGIAKLWGRERITQLSRQRNAAEEADRIRLQAAITEVALAHHLVSEFTSLVAVDVTPVRPAQSPYNSERAPTSAPRGSFWSGTTGFAPTATPAPLLWLLGMSALGFALLLHLRARWTADLRG